MKNMITNTEFKHHYEISINPDWPSGTTDVTMFQFPVANVTGEQIGLAVEVTPYRSKDWLGVFLLGYQSPKALSGVFCCPNPDAICIVSGGRGYMIPVQNPDQGQELEAFPITNVICLVENELIILADFTTLHAFGPNGKEWSTRRLVYDDLKIVDINPVQIRGTGWDGPMNREVDYVVDLATGRHVGGSHF